MFYNEGSQKRAKEGSEDVRRIKEIGWLTVVIAALTLVWVGGVFANDEAAVDPGEVWVMIFEDSIANPEEFRLPLGDALEGGFMINRSVTDGVYRLTMQSSEGKYNVTTLPNFVIPHGYRTRIETAIRMPAFDPYVCSGITFAEKAGSFYDFLICSDRTYALYQNSNGNWTELIPFMPFTTVDPGELIAAEILIREGWADFSLGGEVVDTYKVGDTDGYVGFFAQPISDKLTTIDISRLRVEVSPERPAGTVKLANGIPDGVARSLRMLSIKGRIDRTDGQVFPIEDTTLTLANLGYFTQENFHHPAQDVLLQAKIHFKSAYERPDFAKAGCGFMIRARDAYNYVQLMMALDGAVYLKGVRNGAEVPIANYSYSSWSVEGQAELALIATGAKMTVMYNGRVLGTIQDATWIMEGDAGLSVFSGTNFDYGQSCEFTDILYFVFAQN